MSSENKKDKIVPYTGKIYSEAEIKLREFMMQRSHCCKEVYKWMKQPRSDREIIVKFVNSKNPCCDETLKFYIRYNDYVDSMIIKSVMSKSGPPLSLVSS